MRAVVYSVLIGGLVGAWIFWPRYHGSRPSPIMAAKMQISNFETALEAYHVDNGYYPQRTNGLFELLSRSTNASNWRGPYLQGDRIAKDPWGHVYHYEFPGKHNTNSFDISSDGPPGKNMVIGNW